MKRIREQLEVAKRLCKEISPAEAVFQLLLLRRPRLTLPLIVTWNLYQFAKRHGIPIATTFGYVELTNVEFCLKELRLKTKYVLPSAIASRSQEFESWALRRYPLPEQWTLGFRVYKIDRNAPATHPLLDWREPNLAWLVISEKTDLSQKPLSLEAINALGVLCSSDQWMSGFVQIIISHNRLDVFNWLNGLDWPRRFWRKIVRWAFFQAKINFIQRILELRAKFSFEPFELNKIWDRLVNWLVDADRADLLDMLCQLCQRKLDLVLPIELGALETCQRIGYRDDLRLGWIGSSATLDWLIQNGWDANSPANLEVTLLLAVAEGRCADAMQLLDRGHQLGLVWNSAHWARAFSKALESAAPEQELLLLLDQLMLDPLISIKLRDQDRAVTRLNYSVCKYTRLLREFLRGRGKWQRQMLWLGDRRALFLPQAHLVDLACQQSVAVVSQLVQHGFTFYSEFWLSAIKSGNLDCLQFSAARSLPWLIDSSELRQVLGSSSAPVWRIVLDHSTISRCLLFPMNFTRIPHEPEVWHAYLEYLCSDPDAWAITCVWLSDRQHVPDLACFRELSLAYGRQLLRNALSRHNFELANQCCWVWFGFSLSIDLDHEFRFELATKQDHLFWSWPLDLAWRQTDSLDQPYLIDHTGSRGLVWKRSKPLLFELERGILTSSSVECLRCLLFRLDLLTRGIDQFQAFNQWLGALALPKLKLLSKAVKIRLL